MYYDEYDLNEYLSEGENVIGIMLGNGFANSNQERWKFNEISWRSAPKIALEIYQNDDQILDISSFKTYPSEVIFDDFHLGERIDANFAIKNWDKPGFDDSSWTSMIPVDAPTGELLRHPSFYPVCYEEVKPIKVIKGKNGYIYDFGASCSAMYRIKIKGQKGHTIKLFMNDAINEDKTIFMNSIVVLYTKYVPYDYFTLSGDEDVFINRFSHKAGRYLELSDITDEEAKTVDITLYKISSIPHTTGYFNCDEPTLNSLQQMTIVSDQSNFVYFPTDCPHREKNGWTGDVALSAEQFMLNFNCNEELKEWLKSVIKAQNEEGTIPGIVPTDTWGFAWGNGPGWDEALFEVPYRAYIYSGDMSLLEMVHDPIIKYLKYLKTKENEKGLFKFGLGDWLPANTRAPVEIVDSILCKATCDLGEQIMLALNDKEHAKEFADYSKYIKKNFNIHYPPTCPVEEFCQAWGAMGLYYDVFDDKDKAFDLLMKAIEHDNYYLNFGVLTNKAMWRLLAEHNKLDLAIEMMTKDSRTAFKKWVDSGATTLLEGFCIVNEKLDNLPLWELPKGSLSLNHHFWGDMSAFFYRHLAGIQIDKPNELVFAPSFSKHVNHVEAETQGIKVEMSHKGDEYLFEIDFPRKFATSLKVPDGYICSVNSIHTGKNVISFKKA